jgi:chromosome segregation ATPase
MWQHGVEQETLLDALDWKFKKIADERDRLRADNAFLKDGIEKHVEQGIRLGERAETAEAEIDRLQTSKKVLAEREAAMLQMIDELRDEIDRLREALEKIGFADECVGSARDIALKALAKEAGQ